MQHADEKRWWEYVSQLTAVALILLGIAAIPFALRVPVDNRLENFLNINSKSGDQYNRFREAFGSDEYVIAAYTGKDLFDPEALDAQLDTYDLIRKVPNVRRVSGLPQVYEEVFGAEDAEELKKDFLSTPFYKNFLISEDGTVAGLFLETEQPEQVEGRRELIRGIEASLQPLRDHGFQVHLVGPPALHLIMEDISSREARRTFPVALVCSLLMMIFLFRSFRAMLVAVLSTGLTIVLVVGLMGLLGQPMNMVTSVMPVLLWVLGLANIIHITRSYQECHASINSVHLSVTAAMRDKALPCALAALTTAFGFLSLLLANMRPIRELGAFASAGLLISLMVNLSVGPLLIGLFRVPAHGKKSPRPMRWAVGAGNFAMQHSRMVLFAGAAIVGLTLYSLTLLRVESNTLTFLPDDSETVQTYDFVSQRLTGLYSLEVVVVTPNGWLDERCWEPIEELTRKLTAQAGVARVVSPLDLVKKLNQWDHDFDPAHYMLPGNGAAAEALVGELDEPAQEELNRIVSADGKQLRLSVLVRDTDSSRFMRIKNDAEALLKTMPPPLDGYATGIVLQLAEAQLGLVTTQISSFSFAFVSIFLCILIGLRSWRLTLVSFAPNLLPILSAFGVMALLDVPLDPATVMVASVALGIAVDNAIHLLTACKTAQQQENSLHAAVGTALAKVGPPITISTATACMGFFALGWSAFTPIHYFGVLSCFAMLMALVADVFLVPAILKTLWGRWFSGPANASQGFGTE